MKIVQMILVVRIADNVVVHDSEWHHTKVAAQVAALTKAWGARYRVVVI